MVRLFETPDTCEFWQAMYSAQHQRLGQFFYVLTVPRRVAADFAAVTALVKGAVLDQVKTFLDVLPASDKNHMSKFVADGWFLV